MTDLQKQLKRLKTPQTEEFRQQKYRISFLYDKKEAASIDADTHLRIANKGFKKLVKLNPELQEYADLFSSSSIDLDRSTLHKEENDQLSIRIRKYLHNSVIPFFMLNDCHETLEYLLYKYHIHTYQQDDFLCALLPYHETRLFARAIQTVTNLDEQLWAWLTPYKNQGVPVSSDKLINVLGSRSKQPLITLLSDKLIEINRDTDKAGIYTSFYTTTVICLLDRDLDEKFYVIFMPCVYRCIKKANNVGLFMSSLVLLGYLAYTQELEESYSEKLTRRLTKTYEKLCQRDESSCGAIGEYYAKVVDLLKIKIN